MALPVTDTFTNFDGTTLPSHNGSWSIEAGGFDIQSNNAHPDQPNNEGLARWTGDSFNPNQYSIVTLSVGGTGRVWAGTCVRMDASGNAYGTDISTEDNTQYITEFTSGNSSTLTSTSQTPADGATLELQVTSSTLDSYYNGAATPLSITDSTLTTGEAGVEGWDDGQQVMLEDWEAGNLGAAPTGGNLLTLLGVG